MRSMKWLLSVAPVDDCEYVIVTITGFVVKLRDENFFVMGIKSWMECNGAFCCRLFGWVISLG